MKFNLSRLFLLTVYCGPRLLFASPSAELVNPNLIEMSGLERHVSLATEIGRIELRWTRESEKLFGQTPERATIEAASAVAKALRQSSFPTRVTAMRPDWQVVFLSKDIKAGQIPTDLISNCHPGWMTRPANIYIAAEQVAGGCGGTPPSIGRVTDAALARVMIHEMGHVVEYTFAPEAPFDRLRAEGFASWFEVFAGRFSKLLEVTRITSEQKTFAKMRLANPIKTFNGDAGDYSLGACLFHTILKDKSILDLTSFYDLLSKEQLPFIQGVLRFTGWSQKRLNEKLLSYVNGASSK